MMIVFYVFIGIIVLTIALLGIAPKKYDVKRSIVIKKPIADVFIYLKYIKNQDDWSPWKKKDSNLKQEFFGVDGEVGFLAKWEGNKDVGIGEQEILSIEDNTSINSKLRFYKPWKSESDAYIQVLELTTNKTKVTWGFSGKNKIPFNIFMLFFNMDKAVGKDFEEGLLNLKNILEK